MTVETRLFGAVEAGGTKFLVAVGNGRGEILAQQRFPTTDPVSTLAAMHAFLRQQVEAFGRLTAIGMASFGPVELDKNSIRHGFIGRTPKPDWSGTDMVGSLAEEFRCPIAFNTDVNAAALAEHRWGAGQDVNDLVYLTIGTGIGGGILVDGSPIHGLMHPEIGHIYPPASPSGLRVRRSVPIPRRLPGRLGLGAGHSRPRGKLAAAAG